MPRKQAEVSTLPVNFESAILALETVVQRMESGELSLEDSLKAFEHGVSLTRQCQEALKAAEQRVKLLSVDGQERDFPLQGDA